MKENANNSTQKKNETLKAKSIVAYVKNYARNCRYSFNSMLQA
jgi:hypothetical protein